MVPPACSSSSGRGPDPASSAGHCDQHLPTTRRGIFADFSKQQRTSVSSGRNASAPGSTAEAAMGQQCISNVLVMHQQGTSSASAMYQRHAFYERQVRHKQNAMETESAYINLMIPLLSSWMSSTTVALEQENMSINWWKCSRRQSVSFIFCKHIYMHQSRMKLKEQYHLVIKYHHLQSPRRRMLSQTKLNSFDTFEMENDQLMRVYSQQQLQQLSWDDCTLKHIERLGTALISRLISVQIPTLSCVWATRWRYTMVHPSYICKLEFHNFMNCMISMDNSIQHVSAWHHTVDMGNRHQNGQLAIHLDMHPESH